MVIQNELQANNPDLCVTYWFEVIGEYLNDRGEIIKNWNEMIAPEAR